MNEIRFEIWGLGFGLKLMVGDLWAMGIYRERRVVNMSRCEAVKALKKKVFMWLGSGQLDSGRVDGKWSVNKIK